MPTRLKAADLHEESSDRKQFSAQALHPLEGRDGFLFALVSVHGKSSDRARPAAAVLEHIRRLAETFGTEANVQFRFEQFLGALNETLSAEVRSGEWNVPVESFGGVVGIACDDRMFLSGTGDLSAIFLHRTPDQRYQVFNLFRSIQTEQALPTWEKPFAVVLDGDLHPGDVFCVTNRDLGRFVPGEELNAILSTLPPLGAAEKIRHYFPANADLSLIVVQSSDVPEPMTRAQPLASVSLDRLARTTDDTASLLDDQRPNPVRGLVGSVRRLRGMMPRASSLRSLWRILLSSVRVGGRIVGDALRFSGRTAASAARRETRALMVAAVRSRADRTVRGSLEWFNRLPRVTKTLAVAAISILVVLAGGITVLQRSQARSVELAAYEEQVVRVEDAIERAAGAVIYKDESQARALYAEALALAQALPVDTDAHAARAAELEGRIEGAFNDLRHLINVPEPTALGSLDAAAGISGRAMFASGGGVYVLGSDKNAYLLDPSSRSLTRVETAVGEVGIPAEVSSEDGLTLFLDDRPGVSRIDLSGGLLQITNVQPPDGTRWSDIALYNGRLYALQPTDGQIIKYQPTGAGFDGGTRWVRARSTDLSNAVSMAIDATVFVLRQDGSLVRFVGGAEVGWDQEPADPAMTGATDVWTDAASAFVYVLEPATQRLVVFEKETGDLVTQYRSDAFQGLTDFLVDEQNRILYFLSGSNLYSITASHLK